MRYEIGDKADVIIATIDSSLKIWASICAFICI